VSNHLPLLGIGMKNLADYLHNKGFKLGVYTDAGEYTCSSGERPYKIPGAFGHYEQDAATFASWGVDQVKMDWCNTKLANGTQLDPKIQYPQMTKALNKTGRPIWFAACEWVTLPDSLRIQLAGH
jgi:alpha-galactosidase